MANSRKLTCADVVAEVAGRLRSALPPDARVLLGLSGGLDSVVLLDILWRLSPRLDFSLEALHVNHGISHHASEWGAFCAQLCRDKNVPCEVIEVDLRPYRHLGLEGAAREARYKAFKSRATGVIVVAQHRDDQAETLLLQLMRGAGPKGLAGMLPERGMPEASELRLLRPLLGVSRTNIEAYARELHLDWIEDESNSDVRLRRNFLRARVLPAMEEGFPGAQAAIAQSAGKLAEATALLGELADQDLRDLQAGQGLLIAKLLVLGASRARNALRRWCEMAGHAWPGDARLNELLRQLATARPDAMAEVLFGEWAFRAYRGVLYVIPQGHPVGACLQSWKGEPSLAMPALGGTAHFERVEGRGISAARLNGQAVTLRARQGGEKMQLHRARPRRTLKNLFQERGVHPWQRYRLPMVYCEEQLIAVPEIGEDCDWRASTGEAGWVVRWEWWAPGSSGPGS